MQTFPAPRSLSQIPPPGSEAYKRLREAQPLFVASKNGGTDRSRSSRRRFRLPRIRTIVLSSVAAATAFFWYHLETVPVSGRRRFNFYPEHFIAKISSWQARALEQEIESKGGRFLPESDPRTRLVKRVMARLIPVSGGGKLVDHTLPQDGNGERGRESATEGAHSNADEVQWEVRVIDDPTTANAFVLPGGKVFVFSGILHAANTEAGLAAVLGHEIAHNMAAHVAERLSDDFGTNMVFYTTFVLSWGATLFLFSIFGDMKSLLLTMPMSRKQESEADYIGLMLMAEACYDPRAALGFWQRMSRLAKAHGGEPPELLSTHPSVSLDWTA